MKNFIHLRGQRIKIVFGGILILCTLSCTQQGHYVVRDYVPASQVTIPKLDIIKEKAFAGDPVAQFEYGRLFYEGLGVRKSRKEASYWWAKSAEGGNPNAQYALGIQYYGGLGIKADFDEGCKWLMLAASHGHPLAQKEVVAKCTR